MKKSALVILLLCILAVLAGCGEKDAAVPADDTKVVSEAVETADEASECVAEFIKEEVKDVKIKSVDYKTENKDSFAIEAEYTIDEEDRVKVFSVNKKDGSVKKLDGEDSYKDFSKKSVFLLKFYKKGYIILSNINKRRLNDERT